MARYESFEEKQGLTNGSIVYAYAFQANKSKEGLSYNQKPVKGRLSFESWVFNGAAGEMAFSERRRPRFFVPFKKNSESEFAWSKTVHLHTRCYADTEAEAVQGYNQLIQDEIDWHQDKICKLKERQL